MTRDGLPPALQYNVDFDEAIIAAGVLSHEADLVAVMKAASPNPIV